jgi:RHS repeat-associated protein
MAFLPPTVKVNYSTTARTLSRTLAERTRYNKVHMKNYEQRMHENGIGDVFGYDAVYHLTNAKFNVTDPTVENPTDFERERNISLDHLDNITRIDETKNGETSQITTEIPPDTDFLKLNQYSRFDQWGLTFDKNGNLTQKGTQKMYFDFRNQAVRVTDANTSTENKYDALGRRLQKFVTIGSQSYTENFYHSGHQVIEVRDGNDQVKRQFIYGNGIDEVIRMDVYNGSAITPYYFHSNAIGSTTAVTDANGQVVERYKYGLFGMPTFMDAACNVIPKSTIGNNILFQGREYEPETNFYYFRARHLDPIMGRFLQTDPMGYEDSLNLYQALNMNPVNFTDPFGLYTDFYWEAKENRNREKGPTEPNPADAMTRAALGQHAKNTAVNFGLYAVATEVPVVGPAFVAGYATRQVGEGYIDYLNQRWNVSVMESGTSRFFKKASAPVMALLDLIGITGGVRSITDDSLSDEERGKLLMNSYNQLSWTAIGGYYGWKQINGRTSGPKFNNLSESEIFQIKKALKEADMSDASVLLEGADMPPDYYGMTLGDKGFIINRSIINNYNLLLETLKHELKHILDRRDIGNPGAYGSHLEDAANAAEKIK